MCEDPGFKRKFTDGSFYSRPFVERYIRFDETEMRFLYEKKENLEYLEKGKSIFANLLKDESKIPILDNHGNLYIDAIIFLKGHLEYEDLSNICIVDAASHVVLDFRFEGDLKDAFLGCLKRATPVLP